MKRDVFKLKLWVGDDTDSFRFIDWYFDVNQISGFYIPKDDGEEACINIMYNGDTATVKQETHIIRYLTENFVDRSKR